MQTHLGPVALRLLDEWPQVQVVRQHVAGPDDDVAGVDQRLGIDGRGWTDGHDVGGDAAAVAEGALRHAGAQSVEEPVANGKAVEDAHVAEVAVGQD